MNVFLISQKIEFDSARKVDDKLVIFFLICPENRV